MLTNYDNAGALTRTIGALKPADAPNPAPIAPAPAPAQWNPAPVSGPRSTYDLGSASWTGAPVTGSQMAESVKYAGSNPGSWYDASKYDPNNLLSSVNAINGMYMAGSYSPEYWAQGGNGPDDPISRYTGDPSQLTYSGSNDGGYAWYDPSGQAYQHHDATPAYVISSNGTKINLSGDANSGYTFADNYNDPSGKSAKDQMRVTYKYDPVTGAATPIATQGYYQPSDWVDTYRPILQYLAPVLTAGAAGAYFGAAGAAGEGAGAGAVGSGAGSGAAGSGAADVSGMDLAADAAVGTGNNIATAGGALGGGGGAAVGGAGAGAGTATGGTEVSGMDLAADAAAGTGNNITTAGGALGAGGGAAGTSLTDYLTKGAGSVANWALKNPGQAAALIGALGGSGSSGGGSGGTSGSPLSHAVAAQDMGKAAKYGYTGFTPRAFTPRAGHSQLSNAVNVNDPSAAMFGVGQTPTYYKVPGMAEGGSVDDTNPWGGDERAYPSAGLPSAYADVPATQAGYHDPRYGDNPDVRPWYAPATDWLNKLSSGDPKSQKQMVMGMGALGLIASLLNKNRAPGFRSVADMQAGLGHNAPMSAADQAKMSTYFNTPAVRYVSPPAPQVLVARADGGRIEPKVGTRGPVRVGGTGGGLSPEALRLLAQADGAPAQPSGVGALPANPVTNPTAITASRMQSAGLAHGGQPVGSPVVEFNPMAHGSRVPGDGPGQTDSVPSILAPGEYVFDADTVSSLGDGNNAAGANVLDRFREELRAHKRGAPVSDIPPQAKSPLAYLAAAKQNPAQKGAK